MNSSGKVRPDVGATLLELYDDALPQVYGYLLARCGCRPLAEDLTAETFLAAVDPGGLDPWDEQLDAMLARQVLGEQTGIHRAALTLRYLDGFSVPEVADARTLRGGHGGAARARPRGAACGAARAGVARRSRRARRCPS